MIVLAVSAAIFISIAASISGRQHDTEFSQAVGNVRDQVQQVINEVGSGFYPNGQDFTCNSSGVISPVSGSSGVGQGSNGGCIFIGKVLHFMTGPDPQIYRTYGIAGRQINSSNQQPVDTVDDAYPKVLASPTVADYNAEKQTYTQEYGLNVLFMCYGNCAASHGSFQPTGSVAFVSLSGSDATGSQAVNVLPIIDGSSTINNAGSTEGNEAAAIQRFFNKADPTVTKYLASQLNPADGVSICFVSGATNQSALMTIGGNSRTLNVNVSILEDKTCG